jgi:hypothetical protein
MVLQQEGQESAQELDVTVETRGGRRPGVERRQTRPERDDTSATTKKPAADETDAGAVRINSAEFEGITITETGPCPEKGNGRTPTQVVLGRIGQVAVATAEIAVFGFAIGLFATVGMIKGAQWFGNGPGGGSNG